MTPVDRRTNPAAGTDRLLQLTDAPSLPTGPGATRHLAHPQELTLRGIPVMCSVCRARRDWLLINHGRNVWVVCRCGKQWLEPEITRARFDALIFFPDGTVYPSVDQALTALGFDGTFAGTYLD
ncbi:hypothetical protein [Streptomyces sp. NPDC057509]|uniref:hypothetical protein n=1 Tax=Streptomyces sp. NPDC057509 TaxID=3346152 RepID=UPI0036A79B43